MAKPVKILLITLSLILLVSVSFGSGILISQRITTAHPYLSTPRDVPKSMEAAWEVWTLLTTEYVEKQNLDTKKIQQGAIKGMMDALKDPYSSYLDAENNRLETSNLHGSFEGIGAQVGMKENQLIVIAPIPDTPAEKAGIRPGDALLEIEGQSTAGLSLAEAVIKIRGPKGTPITLLVRHEGKTTSDSITIVRAEIKVKSVRWQPRGDVAHIQIFQFSGDTGRELNQALDEINRQGSKQIVLDLRSNPGGLLTEVVAVASQFLKEGQTVLYTVNNQGERREMKASAGGKALERPIVILVDSHSASGSEVLSGALQDHKRALVMGTKTFGKGSVNMLFPLRDGSGLYLTTGRWLTPNGRPIEGKGLDPDVEAVTKPEDRASGKDPALDQALEYLKGLKTAMIPSIR
ncbi:MAG: S41 family peptidase [Dehalococcoidia bacterium]|nr:S41 family peptidase [Dehalococcoidia bacterium]